MSDYNKYIAAVNKIFECLEKMKTGWKNQDNYNYIDSIYEYKNIIIKNAELLKNSASLKEQGVEKLSND